MSKTPWIRVIIAAAISFGTTIWGWYGWLVIAWIVSMALDYVSGSIAAAKAHEWTSDKARHGLFHKLGMFVAVAASVMLDLLFAVILRSSQIVLPFSLTGIVSGLVMCWYTLTELGSLLENAVKLGAPVPEWLRRILKTAKDAVDDAGDKTVK